VKLFCCLAVVLLSAALAACGGSSSSSSSSTPAASASASSSTSSSTTSTMESSTASRTSTRSTLATSKTLSEVSTAPPPIPSGPPAAPAGLARTTGYAMYENCSSHCSGAVPAALRRSLHLPSGGCPMHAEAGPVSMSGSPTVRVSSFIGSSWDGSEVMWAAQPGFRGPILIRGRQLVGTGAVGFGEGRTPYDELQIYASGKNSWPSFARVRAAGCYAFQIDTTHASQVVVFKAAK
jgi:hypothetical protein